MGNLFLASPRVVPRNCGALFGSAEAASSAWFGHRAALLAADTSPGRRLAGFWLFERGMEPPRVGDQESVLRQLGELSPDEESTLAVWAPWPRGAADIALDTNRHPYQ